MSRLLAIIAALALSASAIAQWTVGHTSDFEWDFGATDARYAAQWPPDEPWRVKYFYLDGEIMGPPIYNNGFVCWRLSDNAEYAIVANYYLNWWYWCEDGNCAFVDTGYAYGIDDAGDVWGGSAPVNSHAVLWTHDATQRWDYPQWRNIVERDHWSVTFRDHYGQMHAFGRYDCNCDGRLDNFDITPFVNNLLGWDAKPCQTLWMDGFDIDPFAEAITR